MRLHFTTEQWLPFPVHVAFAFFANPANLPPLMPAWQEARLEDATLIPPPEPPAGTPRVPGIAAGSGTELLITARALPGVALRGRWLAVIEDFHWNDHFCDVQRKGPFAYWRHCHRARAVRRRGQEGTVVRDEVEYALPMQLPGRSVAQAGLSAMFQYRQRRASLLLPEFAAKVSSQVEVQAGG